MTTNDDGKPQGATGSENHGRAKASTKRGKPKRPRAPRAPRKRQIHPNKGAANSARAAKAKLLAVEALRLRSMGLSLDAIAQRIGHKDRSSVRRAILREMQAMPVEDVETLRKVETMKIDRIERNLHAIADDDDESAHDRIDALKALISLANRRSKLHGLDAPLKTELTGKDGGPVAFNDISSTEADLTQRLDQLRDELFGGERPGPAGGQRQPSGESPPGAADAGGERRDVADGGADEEAQEAGPDGEPPTTPSV